MAEPDDDPKGGSGRYKSRQTFCACIARGMDVGRAARSIGITRETAYQWRRTDEVFAAQWTAALEHRTDQVECVLFEQALAGMWPALPFYLKHLKPSVYDPRVVRVAIGGDPLHPMTMEHRLTGADDGDERVQTARGHDAQRHAHALLSAVPLAGLAVITAWANKGRGLGDEVLKSHAG